MPRAVRPDEGQAGVEALAFGMLLCVVVVLLVANAWAVVDANMAVSAAAREGARAAIAARPEADLAAGADAAARDTLKGYGRDAAAAVVKASGELVRCERVEVEVSYRVPSITLPWIGGFGRGFITATGRSTEVVDPLRSGLPGEATCAG